MATANRPIVIPGVGTFRTTLDQITIYSDIDKATIEKALPIGELEASAYSFALEKVRGKRDTRIKFTCLPDMQPVKLLKRYEGHLGSYRVTSVEIAADNFDCGNKVARARAIRAALFKVIGKRNHQRGYLIATDRDKNGKQPKREQLERRGLVDNDFTVYFEDDEADLGLKVYLRHEKRARHKKHGPVGCRIEFTLARNRSVRVHLGGDRLDDLLTANLHELFMRHLYLEEVDFERLGYFFSPKTVMRSKGTNIRALEMPRLTEEQAYRARRVAYHVIRVLDEADWINPPTLGREMVQTAPAQIRGLLRRYFSGPLNKRYERKVKTKKGQEPREELRLKPVPKRIQNWIIRKRTGSLAGRRNALTMKKLEACFTTIPFGRNSAR